MNETISGPLVTVLMPVYNAERYLRQAMDSVLSQTFRDFEFLILDDGSTDASRDIAASYDDPRIRLVDNATNIGLIPTLNKGLRLAKAGLIARQDADDICEPERLEIEYALMDHCGDVALVGSRGWVIDEHGAKTAMRVFEKPVDPDGVRWFLFFDNPFIHTSVMFRKTVALNRYGGYRMSDWCGDYDLWSRMACDYPMVNLPRRLVSYRVHSSSLIGSLNASEEDSGVSTAENVAIISRNLAHAFGDGAFTKSEAETLRLFVNGIDERHCGGFFATFEKLLAAFRGRNPECDRSDGFRAFVALQYANVAYGLLPGARPQAFRLYKKAVGIYPAIVRRLPWGRMLTLALAGEAGRSMYRRIRRLTPR